MNIFTLTALLTLNSRPYKQGLKDSQESTKKAESGMKTAFKGIATAATTIVAAIGTVAGALTKLITTTANYGDTIDKQSQQIGISQKAYQEWSYILKQNGTDISALDSSMKTFIQLIVEASQGNAEALITFSKLGEGISYADFVGMSIEETFAEIIKRFQEMPEGADKSTLAMEIFGRSGRDLLPLLNSSAESVDELRQRFYDLGIYLDEDAVASAVETKRAWEDTKLMFQGVMNAISTALMPAFLAITNWITNNQETFLWLSGFLVGLIATIWLVNAAVSANPIVLIITAIIVAIGLLVAGILWLKDNWEMVVAFILEHADYIRAGLTLILGPIGLLISAIWAIWENWDIIAAFLKISWQNVSDFFKNAWQLIIDFLKISWEMIKGFFISAGDSIKLVWQAIIDWFKSAWQAIETFFKTSWETIKGFFSNASNGVKTAWQTTIDWFKSAWQGVSDWFGNLWDNFKNIVKVPINFIIDAINKVIGGLNSLSVKIPKWVPGVGGETWGINISTIPKLAQGTVTGVNNPFLAIVGDNPTEQEIISPLSTMKKAVTEAIAGMNIATQRGGTVEGIVNGFNGALRQNRQENKFSFNLFIDGKQVEVIAVRAVDEKLSRMGKPKLSGAMG